MPLSTKSSSKQPVAEKRVKGSRKVALEEVKEELKEEVIEEIKEDPVLEPVYQSVTFEAGANACCESMQEVECPACEEPIEEHNEPITLVKKCAKFRPQVNEAGDYLNPITNRYLKFGSSNFKKLLRDGVIKPIELNEL